MKVSKASEADIHEKSWGHEEWITNSYENGYCGKRLVFRKAAGCTSLHFHASKHETMWCLKGSFCIITVDPRDATESQHTLLQGDSLAIPQLTPHRIQALEDGSELVEFSTTHWDEDSYRVKR